MTEASICTIGDEILIGQIVDTNSSNISKELGKVGIKVRKMLSISDSREEIKKYLIQELQESDIVIVTGGLGPTKDDVTKDVLYELSGSTCYVEHEGQKEINYRILAARGLDKIAINVAQASVPDACDVIPNQLGTAPIMAVHFDSGSFSHCPTLYSLPGVPHEALGALDDIICDIRLHHPLENISHRTIMTFGLAESALAEKIADWEDHLPSCMHLAYLPNALTGVRLRLSIYGEISREDCDRLFDQETAKLRTILGSVIYAEQEQTLEETVGNLLRLQGKTISTAESCTGGRIASLITSVPGSSEYYLGSVVSYANEVKHDVLGVPSEILGTYGAVSPECVAAMAEGVRRITGTDYAVATSGIAGPGGGTDEKPVGLVWVGVSSEAGTFTRKFFFRSDRKRNIERFAASALDTVRLLIQGELNN